MAAVIAVLARKIREEFDIMSIEKVRSFFRSHGMEERVLEFAESSATVELAAHAVGCEPARIAKTLSFDLTGEPILVVTAGDNSEGSLGFMPHDRTITAGFTKSGYLFVILNGAWQTIYISLCYV